MKVTNRSSTSLPDSWSKFLANEPETGMGFQKVNITLNDGSNFRDVVVMNGQHIPVCPEGLDVSKIAEIKVDPGVHDWNRKKS